VCGPHGREKFNASTPTAPCDCSSSITMLVSIFPIISTTAVSYETGKTGTMCSAPASEAGEGCFPPSSSVRT
jgi:hypothetical protein